MMTFAGTTSEGLVRPFAADFNLSDPWQRLSQFVKRNDQCIADRPIHVPDDLRQQIEILRLGDDLMMVCAEKLSGFPRGRSSSVGAPKPTEYVLMLDKTSSSRPLSARNRPPRSDRRPPAIPSTVQSFTQSYQRLSNASKYSSSLL